MPGTDRPKAVPLTHPQGTVKKPPPVVGFMRGMNLGNALEAPKEGAWGVTLDVAHFEAYSKEGFDHVRMPVKFSAHIDKSAPFTIEPSFFARVDWAIDQALSHNLSIIVDLHHYDELINEPDTHVEPFLAMWKQIAERYKGRPKTVAFELLNEPHDNLKPDKLNQILNDAIKAIRVTNPDRIIIVDPYNWASAEHLHELDMPTDDANLVATFHCYTPMLFTHQGSSFMSEEYQTTGIVFPGPPKRPVVPVPGAERWTGREIGWRTTTIGAPPITPAGRNRSTTTSMKRSTTSRRPGFACISENSRRATRPTCRRDLVGRATCAKRPSDEVTVGLTGTMAAA